MFRWIKSVAKMGIPFGFAMAVVFSLMSGLKAETIVSGMVCGLIFGTLLTAFTEWQRGRFEKYVPDFDGELLLKDGPANHFRGFESVGGWLYLTNYRLLFRSHRYNVQNHELSIPLGAIRDAQPSMTLGIIPNGLRISTEIRKDRFVVESRKDWADEIRRAAGATA